MAGGDENVVSIAWIAADEGEAVNRLHHLAGPAILNSLDHWETISRPLLELTPALRAIMLLAGLVILAANDQDIRLLASFSAQVMVCTPQIRRRVPQQDSRN